MGVAAQIIKKTLVWGITVILVYGAAVAVASVNSLSSESSHLAAIKAEALEWKCKAMVLEDQLAAAHTANENLARSMNLVRPLTVSAYSPTKGQCDSDPLIAASMQKVREGTIAVSRDLFDQGWVFGRKVRIEGLGIFVINDLMNKRYTERIDIFMWKTAKAHQFGVQDLKVALLAL